MADIVLRDRSGNPVEYPGVERIKLNTTGGETVEFVDPALIPESVEKTIDPDFSGGNIVETPEAGTMFSKVTVNKPATLDPQYIAEGVNIAGIVGTLAAGGGSNVKIAAGTYKYVASGNTEVIHNLGVVPDCIIMIPTDGKSTTAGVYGVSVAFSDAMVAAYPDLVAQTCSQYNGGMKIVTNSAGLNQKYYGYIRASSATPTTSFYYSAKFMAGVWIAIAGLT